MTESDQSPKRNRRRLRFSLRTFLIVVTLLCVWLAWYIPRVERQKKAVAWVEENGGTVYYAFEVAADGIPLDATKVRNRNWLQRALGPDVYSSVVLVRFRHDNTVENLEQLKPLTGIRYLHIERCDVHDLTVLTSMRGLKILTLPPSVTNVETLSELDQLEKLDFAYSDVSDLTPLSGLTKLQKLWISDTPVKDLTPLATLTNLRELDIRNTPVKDLTPLARLANLEELYICNTQVTDLSPLSNLCILEALRLTQTSISDLTPLANLKNLEYLDYTKTMVSREEIKKTKKTLPNCYFHHD